MAFTFYSDEQDKWGYLAESTWGTPQAASANFKTIKFPKGTKVEDYVVTTNLELNRAARQPESADLHTDEVSNGVRVTVPELLVTRDRLADLLYACLQNRTSQGGAALYLKEYKVNTSQPDFDNDAGYFFTLAYSPPVAGKMITITSCIVKELAFEWDKSGEGKDNLVKITNLVILGKKLTKDLTESGSWVAEGTNRFNAYDFTVKFNDSTAMEWLRCMIKLDNGAQPIDKDTDGSPKSFDLKWGDGTLAFELLTWYNANTTGTIQDVHDDYHDGTTRRYSIQTTQDNTGDGHFKVTFYCRINAMPQGTEERNMMVPIQAQGVHNSISTNDLIIVGMTDSISQ